MMRLPLLVLSLVLVLLSFQKAPPATADAPPSATVFLQSTSVAAGVGVQWGDGILTYNGTKYLFKLQGLEIVGVGYAQVEATGTVSNLTKLSDFEGVYVSAEVSATAGSGPTAVSMTNPHGVTIALHAVQEGAKLTLAAGGVNIEIKKQ